LTDVSVIFHEIDCKLLALASITLM